MRKLTPKEAIHAFCTECLGMEQFNTRANLIVPNE